jgi:hypothetical protein
MLNKWSLLSVLAVLTAMPLAASPQDIRQERLRFKAGATSATVSGSIRGRATVDYVLTARAGQTMTVTLKSSSTANYFNVLPPGSEAAIAIGETVGSSWTGTLPADGDYRIRVFLVRAAARRNEAAKYTLTVSIPRTVDAKVPGTPYHATGPVPCSIGPDPTGSADCSMGVIRKGNGRADVYLAEPGYDVTLHKDKLRILRFDGTSVTSADPKEKVTATKKGDSWTVSVNDYYHYVIPEAVIVGG